jgi:hypothetical protein
VDCAVRLGAVDQAVQRVLDGAFPQKAA